MAEGVSNMVTTRVAFLIAFGTTSIVTFPATGANACERPDWSGRVKSVIVTEASFDAATGRVGERRQALRAEVSRDGRTIETTVYGYVPSEPDSKLTSHFDGERLVRQVETMDGKAVSTTNCSYDPQGRLIEAKTQSGNAELSTHQIYEYGSGSIRLRVKSLGEWHVVNQTLDARGRVIKEVEFNEERATIERTSEYIYSENRKDECVVSLADPRRHCATTVVDSHGNEIDFRGDEQSRRNTFEYDSVGNWVSKRTSITGPRRSTIETIVERKIEYW
jgi:hypothetical protein